MKTFWKRFLAIVVAISAGFASNSQSQAVTLPTTVISFANPAKVTFGAADVSLNITQSAGVTTTTSLTPTVCSLVNNLLIPAPQLLSQLEQSPEPSPSPKR